MDRKGELVKLRNAFGLAWIAMALVGCGGGGGGGDGGGSTSVPSAPTPTPTQPTPAVGVTVTSAPISQTVTSSTALHLVWLEGTWTGSNLTGPVYLKVSDSGNAFELPAPQLSQDGKFRYTIAVVRSPNGTRTGKLTVSACSDAACAKPYTGTVGTVDYLLYYSDLREWETVQGTSSHSGYMPTTIDPARIQEAWQWSFPKDATAASSSIARPATGPGTVFVTGSNIAADGSLFGGAAFALDEATGKPRWTVPIQGHALAPGATRGFVFLPALGSNALLTVVDAVQGRVQYTYGTSQPTAATMAPSFYDGWAFFMGGDTGNKLTAIVAATGEGQWTRDRLGTHATTPAVDGANVYYHSGSSMEVHDRAFGSGGAGWSSVPDPESNGTPYPGTAVPVVTRNNNVIVNSWNSTTRVSKLSSFNPSGRTWTWSTADSYRPLFASAPDVIYAFRRSGPQAPTLDAISEQTGTVLWSWSPPAADSQLYVDSNVVVTENLIFVSTSNNTNGWTWAVDRTTHQAVWRYPSSSYISMSASRMLYLLTYDPTTGMGDRIVAFRTGN